MGLEFLEGRELLTLFTVTTAADNGNNASPTTGSLRAAIVAANADTSFLGADTISFAIPGSGVQTIALQSALPAIGHTVAIDGTMQPGYANNTPVVVIDGSAAGAGSNGLMTTSGGNFIRGLSIVGFGADSAGSGGAAIDLAGTAGGNFIQGDFLGVEPDGTTAKANFNGVFATSPNNTIGGATPLTRDVLSGNTRAGVLLLGPGSTGNVVLGNSIGTNAAETGALGNQYGILVLSSNNTIGGTSAASANVIVGNVGQSTGNNGCGILFEGTASANLVQGNRIGTNRAGTSAILPTNAFPSITYSNAYGIYFGTLQGDTTNDMLLQETVGGTVAGAGNLISGNFYGLAGNVASSLIAGNTVGLNLAGTAAIGNTSGILLGASQTTIGGTTPLARNVISGNNTVAGYAGGLNLQGDSDAVLGNYIGTNAAGLAATGTGNVVGMDLVLTNSVIGSSTIGNGNLISGNSSDAIRLAGNGGDGLFGNVLGLDIQGNPDPNGGNGIALTVPSPAATPPVALMDSIGGTGPGQGNNITHSGGAGIVVIDNHPTGHTGLSIRGNTISANIKLGIDTQNTGTPVPSTLFVNGYTATNGQLTVTGVYFGTPSTNVAVDLYANANDPSGFGQGPIYLGTFNGSTNGAGFAVFSPTFASPASLFSSFSATATGPDNNTSEFSANYPTTAGSPVANLVLQASASPTGPIVVGDLVTLTETVYNLGPNAAPGVVLYDSLPAGLVNGSVATTVGTASLGVNNLVTVDLGTLPPNTLATVTIIARTSTAGTLVNQAGVSGTAFDPYYLDNAAQQAITVGPGSTGPTADLAIIESASTASPLVGSPLTYTISVGNIGPDTSTNATVFDTFPAGATLLGVNSSQGAAPSVVGNAVTVNLGTIAAGSVATITIVVSPTAVGSIVNMANVSGGPQNDPNKANNFTSLTSTVKAGVPNIHLFLAEHATTATGTAGQFQGFILTFENFGPDPATNVTLNDVLPANASYYAAIPSQGGAPKVLPNGLLSVNFGTLSPGAVATLQLVLIPKTVGTLTNVAGVYTPDVLSAVPSYATASVSIIAGPSVLALNGSGNNSQLVVTFNEALNPITAVNAANYQLVAMGKSGTSAGKTISIASITYNPTSHSVILLPAQALDPAQFYKIVVIGSTASGVSDTQGRRLASTLYGAAGGNFSALFFAGSLPQV